MSQPAEPPPIQSHFEKVWNSLWRYFQCTFILMLLLISSFAVGMIYIIYSTTAYLAVEATKASRSHGPPELVEAAATPGEPPAIIVQDTAKLRTAEAMALLGSLQISLAMFLGFTCIFWGLMMTCLGVTAGYDIKAGGNTEKAAASFSLASTSPGILFLIGGLILIGMSLHKDIQYQDKTVVPYSGGASLPPIADSPSSPESK